MVQVRLAWHVHRTDYVIQFCSINSIESHDRSTCTRLLTVMLCIAFNFDELMWSHITWVRASERKILKKHSIYGRLRNEHRFISAFPFWIFAESQMKWFNLFIFDSTRCLRQLDGIGFSLSVHFNFDNFVFRFETNRNLKWNFNWKRASSANMWSRGRVREYLYELQLNVTRLLLLFGKYFAFNLIFCDSLNLSLSSTNFATAYPHTGLSSGTTFEILRALYFIHNNGFGRNDGICKKNNKNSGINSEYGWTVPSMERPKRKCRHHCRLYSNKGKIDPY